MLRVERLAKRIAKDEGADVEVVEAASLLFDIARVITSALQSKKYQKPIYVDQPYQEGMDENTSAIHYLLYKIRHPRLQPKKFHTRLGKKLAKERFEFMKEFAERFIAERKGKEIKSKSGLPTNLTVRLLGIIHTRLTERF